MPSPVEETGYQTKLQSAPLLYTKKVYRINDDKLLFPLLFIDDPHICRTCFLTEKATVEFDETDKTSFGNVAN